MLRQGSDLTKVDTFFFGDLSRSEKLSEIKPLMLEKGIIDKMQSHLHYKTFSNLSKNDITK